MGEIREISSKGDIKLSWNECNETEVEAARKLFNDKIKDKWSAFKDRGAGTKGDRITVFDKHAERIVLVPPISGG